MMEFFAMACMIYDLLLPVFPYLLTALAVAGLFLGRFAARKFGTCPSRGGAWGSAALPLLTLPLLLGKAPAVFAASLGALLGGGLTAHRRLEVTALATFFGASLTTFLTLQWLH